MQPFVFPSVADKVLDGLPHGQANLDDLCSEPGTDGLTSTTALCATPRPVIQSLADLRALLNLSFSNNKRAGNGTNGNPGFLLLGHSSSLVAKSVNAINPRSIVFTPGVTTPTPTTPYNILSFTRGEEFAEVATYDPPNDQVNFYLIAFKKACNLTNSCTAKDLLTPEVEKDWVEISVYEDDAHGDALGNTILDCQQCHQTQGPDAKPILRFQEIAAPYTHSFWQASDGGKALLADYFGAHDDSEAYAGIPGRLISKSDPSLFAKLVTTAGFGTQPNAFPSATIEAEVKAANSMQPQSNVVAGVSSTWTALYAGFVQGLFIAPPYHDVKVTDPLLLPLYSKAYGDYMKGAASDLPDIRQAFKTDVNFQSEIGFRVKPGLDAAGILANACVQCHNSSLDQNISRGNFNAQHLELMSQAERSVAISRILAADTSTLRMPPLPFRSLSEDEKLALAGLLASGK